MFAIAVLLIDMGKGYFAATWLPPLALGLIAFDDRMTLAVLCACAAVLGHVYPLWYGFRGGKGAATLLGVLAGLQAGLVLPVVAVWVLVVAATGYVSLATMLAVASFSVWIIGCRLIGWDYPRMDTVQPLLAFGLWAMLLTLYTHRTNIGRLRSGQESRTRFVRTPRS